MIINLLNLIHQAFKTLIIIILVLAMVLVLNIKLTFSLDKIKSNGVKFCGDKSAKSCVLLCRNLDLNSMNDVAYLREIITKAGRKYRTCTLKLDQCIYSKKTNFVWKELTPERRPKIVNLKILNCLIDLNEMGLVGLKLLKRLTIINTTTIAIRKETFQSAVRLRKLRIQKNRQLQSVEKHFLQNLQLTYLQIREVNLNQSETYLFFRNLTGGYENPTIRILDWSHNNFGHFRKDLLKDFPNINTLKLTNSNIFDFEEETFQQHGRLQNIHFDENKIKRLPEKLLKPVISNISAFFLQGNNLICDCKLEWLQVFAKKFNGCGDFQHMSCEAPKRCAFMEAEMCPKVEDNFFNDLPLKKSTLGSNNSDYIFKEEVLTIESKSGNQLLGNNLTKFQESSRKLSITNENPEILEISLSGTVNLNKAILWLVNFANTTSPVYNRFKIFKQNFVIHVTPDVNYLVCLAGTDVFFQCSIFDCVSLKTQPLFENQTWLTKKSISLSIISLILACLFALVMGALILYLTIHTNPSLIRGNKRVIVVKRHDKAQILIMPRGYEETNAIDNVSNSVREDRQPLEPSRSSISCDTLSTASYVSANQPTQLEILTYRLNRLREILQEGTNFPPAVPSLPKRVSTTVHQRLPPNVDLLFEYEWYTITTTTTTQM